jgi:hypothetical protein
MAKCEPLLPHAVLSYCALSQLSYCAVGCPPADSTSGTDPWSMCSGWPSDSGSLLRGGIDSWVASLARAGIGPCTGRRSAHVHAQGEASCDMVAGDDTPFSKVHAKLLSEWHVWGLASAPG